MAVSRRGLFGLFAGAAVAPIAAKVAPDPVFVALDVGSEPPGFAYAAPAGFKAWEAGLSTPNDLRAAEGLPLIKSGLWNGWYEDEA